MQKNRKTIVLVLVCLVTAGVTVRCGNKSGSSSSVTVSGVAQMGRVANADVKITGLDGNIFCQAITDLNGNYSCSMSPQTAPVVVEITGKADGSTYYTDEASGTKVTVKSTETLRAIVSDASKSASTPVTPFTEENYSLIKSQLGTDFTKASSVAMGTYYQSANQQVADFHGFPVSWIDPGITPSNPADTSATQNLQAMAMAQLSQFLETNNVSPTDGLKATLAITQTFGAKGKLEATNLPAEFQALGAVITDSSKGFQAAAANFASSANCPESLKSVFTQGGGSGLLSAPKLEPKDYIGAAYDRDKTVAAGGKDPCADPNSYACPSSSTFDPAKYDEYKNTYNATIPAGSGYNGSGTYSGITFSDSGTASTFESLKISGVTGSGSTRTIVIEKYSGGAPTTTPSGTYKIQKMTSAGSVDVASGSISAASTTVNSISANSGEWLYVTVILSSQQSLQFSFQY